MTLIRWELRRARSADAEACALVAAATFLETFAGFISAGDMLQHLANKSSPEAFRTWLSDPNSVVRLGEARAGQAPLGYTVLTTPDLPVEAQPGDIELRRIYVLGTMHGSGLGPALMHRMVEDAAFLHRRRILLDVNAQNLRARRFYEKQGFTVAGERRFLVGETWHDDLIYARSV